MLVARWIVAGALCGVAGWGMAQEAVELPPGLEIPTEVPRDAEGRVVGRLWNLTDEPFTYQLLRRRGAVWTPPQTIQPGGVDPLPLDSLNRDDLYNLESVEIRDRFLVIRYPSIGGHMQQKLTGRLDVQEDVFSPYYFYTRDPNGIGVLLQAETVEELRRGLEQLRSHKRLNEEELRLRLEQLVANHVLYPPPPPWYGVSPGFHSTWPVSFGGYWSPACCR